MEASTDISAPAGDLTLRRDWRPGDAEAIVELHRRVYLPEYRVDETFVDDIRLTLDGLSARGWPTERDGAWLADGEHELAGSLLLSDEGDGEGRVRHFVLAPELRGSGLGRRMLDGLLELAHEIGYQRLTLSTFADLRVAAHLYREAGFRVVGEEAAPRWGRDEFVYQHYELALSEPG
jgi:ribosomal protein S18 acetylase RimI-like enzyme